MQPVTWPLFSSLLEFLFYILWFILFNTLWVLPFLTWEKMVRLSRDPESWVLWFWAVSFISGDLPYNFVTFKKKKWKHQAVLSTWTLALLQGSCLLWWKWAFWVLDQDFPGDSQGYLSWMMLMTLKLLSSIWVGTGSQPGSDGRGYLSSVLSTSLTVPCLNSESILVIVTVTRLWMSSSSGNPGSWGSRNPQKYLSWVLGGCYPKWILQHMVLWYAPW